MPNTRRDLVPISKKQDEAVAPSRLGSRAIYNLGEQ